MIEFEGTVTRQLLERARQRHRNRLYLYGGLLLLLAGVAGFIAQPPPLDPSRHGFVAFVAVIGGAMVTRALAKPDSIPEHHVKGNASEQRLTIMTPEHEEHLQWMSFSAAIVGDDYVVLQQSPFFRIVLGREFFRDAAGWDELRAIVTRNVRVVQPWTPSNTLMSLVLWLGMFALALLAAFYFTRPS
jgi:hypothetical protein